jgi:hypothetical protein
MAELGLSESKLLGGLTIAVAQRLGGHRMVVEEDHGMRNLRMAQVDDIVVLDYPADVTGPRSINVYRVDVQDFAAIDGMKFKIDPQRLLYSLQWQHNGTPPDLHLQLVRDPATWFDIVGTRLLGALTRHDPQLCARIRSLAGN